LGGGTEFCPDRPHAEEVELTGQVMRWGTPEVPKPGCRCTARGSRAYDRTAPSRWRASPASPWADLPGSLVRNAAGAWWGSCDQGRRPGGVLSRGGGGPSAGGDRGGGRPGGGADQRRVDAIAFAAITVEGATGPLPRLSGGDDAPRPSTVIAQIKAWMASNSA
jgi:hypothetical protein